jgi:hypothetical protein
LTGGRPTRAEFCDRLAGAGHGEAFAGGDTIDDLSAVVAELADADLCVLMRAWYHP